MNYCNRLLPIGQRVRSTIDENTTGHVIGYGTMREREDGNWQNPKAGTTVQYLVELDASRAFWSPDGKTHVSVLVIHPDNVRDIEEN